MDFCNKLQLLRKQAGLTQDELALKIGVSRQAISKWESGNAYPDLKNIQTLCSFFLVSADTLLNPKYEAAEPSTESFAFNEKELGNNIKRIRTARGITQEAFAEQMKVSRQSVSKWENGSVIPKIEIIILMLSVLGTDLSELLPPIIEDTLQENDEAPAESENIPAVEEAAKPEPKYKKMKLWPIFVFVPLSLIIIVVSVISIILFKPFFGTEPLLESFKEVFFDPQIPLSIIERMEKEGVEVTLGAGDKAIVLKLYASEDAIAIDGLNGEGALILPRKNAEQALAQSVFHPNSGTQFALSAEEYNGLVYLLRSFEQDMEAELMETLEAIMLECEKIAPPKESFSLADGRFALKKTVSYTLDKQAVLLLIDVASAEVKKNDNLNKMYGLGDELKEMDRKFQDTIDAMLARLKLNLEKPKKSVDVVLSFSVVAGKIEGMSYSCNIIANDNTVSATSLDLKCIYGSKPGLEITHKSEEEIEKSFYSTVNKYTYSKEESADSVKLSLTTEISDEIRSEGGAESYKSKENYTLDYNKSTYEFTVNHNIPDFEMNTKTVGTWELDAETGKLAFALTSMYMDGEELMNTDALAISVKALEGVTFPEGKNLFSLTGEEIRHIYANLPAKKFDELAKEIAGEPLGFIYSTEGLLVPPEVESIALGYGEKLLSYCKSQSDDAKYLPAKQAYIYNEYYGIYVLLSHNGTKITDIKYSYKLTEGLLKVYHKAEVSENKITIHNTMLVSNVDASCNYEGKKTYKCLDCNNTYSVLTDALGCDYISCEEDIMWDDGKMHTVRLNKCGRCDKVSELYVLDDSYSVAVWIDRMSDGTYKLFDYNPSGVQIYCVPQTAAADIKIVSIAANQSGQYRLIRIPDGVKTLEEETFMYNSNLQTIILPSTLTEIKDGAFAKAPLLHTIYYCGTEEEWKSVKLGGYAEAWDGVDIIFVPEGVSPETAANSIWTDARIQAAIAEKQADIGNASAAQNAAKNDCVSLVDSGKVAKVFNDAAGGTLAVIGEYENGWQSVRVYSCESFTKICEFYLDFEITEADAYDGYIALRHGKNILLYRQTDGGLEASIEALKSENEALEALAIADGYVYYVSAEKLYAYDISAATVKEIAFAYGMGFMVNRERHRLIAHSNGVSPSSVYFMDTQTAEEIGYVSFIPVFPEGNELNYIGVYDRDEVYNLDGEKLEKIPESSSAVAIEQGKKAVICKALICNEKTNVSLCFDVDGELFIMMKNGADSEQKKLCYYSENAVVLQSGDILLYTEGGYGLIAVSMN